MNRQELAATAKAMVAAEGLHSHLGSQDQVAQR
jgi:hypothetical protein